MKLDQATTALIFPGQGSQSVGMGKELAKHYPAARATFEEADTILGFGLSRLMWEGPEAELNDTVNTQPALFVHSLASFRAFRETFQDFTPAAMAGHSLGELSALAAAGALSFENGLRLVRRRGELMKRAGEQNPGSMAAVLNLGIPELEQVCRAASTPQEPVQVANDNCPGQVVISGAKAAVTRAMEGAKAAGAKRAILLAVSIAAHSQLMAPIQDEWNAAVAAAGIRDATAPIVGNVAGRALSAAADLRGDIEAQMQSRVRWTETIQLVSSQGIASYVEVGTGTVLLGLVRRIAASATGFPLGTPTDFAALQ
jgi:[acyl-carrier-protein] S-malonyltransferase